MLELNQIHTSYNNIKAVKGISLTIYHGEMVCLIGANGAGKSTTLMTISGVLSPEAGSIKFEGKSLGSISASQRVQMGISQVPEGRHIFPEMTVQENLELGAYIQRNSKKIAQDIELVFSVFPRLKERKFQRGGTLSGGEQQMLAIGRAVMSKPKLLLLDEPSLGLAPLIVEQIFEIIQKINENGTTVLLVEQNANLALTVTNRGYVMETGHITMEGNSKDLIADERIRAAYLGE
ncbi:ABC transporter ATP-binding protein [Candidatus Poribacteria bacterium]|nr:ABC transporter ATP-binding protein [Candidatus Poribacteria bacterium]OUT61255.1 MAG: ABC transporter ATP-binding protein [bacterium TMED15]